MRRLFALLLLGPVSLSPVIGSGTALAANPHTEAKNEGSNCEACHAPHVAAVGKGILRDVAGAGGEITPVTFCYGCHDGSAAVNVKTGVNNATFEGLSGHSVEAVESGGGDLTNVCSDCHRPHADSSTRPRIPETTITVTLPDDSTIDRAVTGADNSWCLACHDDENSWYRSLDLDAYPPLSSPTREESGYPTAGTFPGSTVYTQPEKNAHASIPAGSMGDWALTSREATRVAGDCLWCHSGHRGKSEYDGLVARFDASTAEPKDTSDGEYAEVCFLCHTTDGLVEAPDIKTAATGDPVDSGHTIRTSGGIYPPGAPLPCYECHNPHGSSRNNTMNISDALGQNLDPRDPADDVNVGASKAKVRQFCFSCHVTNDADPDTGRPWAWDSTAASGAGAYVPVPTTAKVMGLDRDVAVGVNDLRIPLANGHNKADIDRSCYECHGDVHKPMSGTSEGGVECSVCHSALNGMVDDTSTYHHVLDDTDWDQAPDTAGTYPTTAETLSCVSCHVDHSDYEPLPGKDAARADGKAFSLRDSGTVARPTATDTDAGLCLSCHTAERDRNSTGQKANVITETKVWSLDATWWAVSPHNYDSPGQFNDGSTFRANCAKCHGTLQGTLSSGKFAVHFSPEQRLLNALGDPVQYEVNEEQMCFRCHSEVSDFVANDAGGTLLGDPKPSVSGTTTPSYSWDWYGTQPMKQSNVSIYTQMMASANTHGHKPHLYSGKHLLSDTDETQAYLSANKHIECADCHNHHVVGVARHVYGTDNRVSEAIRGVRGVGFKSGELAALGQVNWPTNDPVGFGSGADDELESKPSATYEYEICFKCHSSANAAIAGVPGSGLAAWGGAMSWTTWPGGGVGTKPGVDNWTNVAQDFNVGNNSRHPVLATTSGYYYATPDATSMTLIPNYQDLFDRGTSTLGDGQVSNGWSPNDTMMCSDCHGDSGAPLAMVPDGTGWKTNPAAELIPQGPHGSAIRFSLRGPGTDWPVKSSTGALITLNDLADETYASNIFCSNCHPATVAAYNKAHRPARGTQHLNCTCVSCHVLVPHGAKMSRLIADASTGAGSMPDRLAYQGNKSNVGILSFKKRTDATDYTNKDCAVTGSACAKGQHQTSRGGFTSNQSGGTWENWETVP